MPGTAVATIYPAKLRHNAERVRALAPRTRVMACVKADGYGHGIVTVARAIEGLADGYAVARLEEALALREAGISAPVLMLEGPLHPDEILEAAHHNLTLCISEERQIEWLEASETDQPLACWLKIDSGMHRLGVAADTAQRAFQRLRENPRVQAGITLCTHFSQADEPSGEESARQLRIFDTAIEHIEAPRSCANSAAIMRLPASHRDWVRPGYMLYGGCPFADSSAASWDLRAAMELSSKVISLREVANGEYVGYGGRWRAARDSRIATVAVGYGDGYPRHAHDGTPILVNGQRAALAGRVSMDMITVDVTDLSDVDVGSPVLLWGEALPVDEVAASADTIGYELLAGLPPRARRVIA